MLGRAVDDGLDALHIGLPGTVGPSVRVADLDTEGNALVAEFALRHGEAPPCMCWLPGGQLIYNTRRSPQMQGKFLY